MKFISSFQKLLQALLLGGVAIASPAALDRRDVCEIGGSPATVIVYQTPIVYPVDVETYITAITTLFIGTDVTIPVTVVPTSIKTLVYITTEIVSTVTSTVTTPPETPIPYITTYVPATSPYTETTTETGLNGSPTPLVIIGTTSAPLPDVSTLTTDVTYINFKSRCERGL